MPAGMWRQDIHSLLDLLGNEFPDLLEHILSFIYIACRTIALLYENVLALQASLTECLREPKWERSSPSCSQAHIKNLLVPVWLFPSTVNGCVFCIAWMVSKYSRQQVLSLEWKPDTPTKKIFSRELECYTAGAFYRFWPWVVSTSLIQPLLRVVCCQIVSVFVRGIDARDKNFSIKKMRRIEKLCKRLHCRLLFLSRIFFQTGLVHQEKKNWFPKQTCKVEEDWGDILVWGVFGYFLRSRLVHSSCDSWYLFLFFMAYLY